MKISLKQFGLQAMSGEDQSFAAAIALRIARGVEPFYATAMTIRNKCYDRGMFATHDLGRPTISVGNITTGGTGKTPVVRWLAEQLRSRGRRPAILLRGYGSAPGDRSDEFQLLDRALNSGGKAGIPVHAGASRVEGAQRILKKHPEVDMFLLDDAFQHRRASRDFNLVLISATNPFGFGHVLPRGLLREPLKGLKRADAFLITRCSQVDQTEVWDIDRYLTDKHPDIPVYHCDHQHAALWFAAEEATLPVSTIAGEKLFLFAGIGDPASFEKQFHSTGCHVVGTHWFEDHHAYSRTDVAQMVDAAAKSGASRMVTTEKDWVKLIAFADGLTFPIAVTQLAIQFHEDDEERRCAAIFAAIRR